MDRQWVFGHFFCSYTWCLLFLSHHLLMFPSRPSTWSIHSTSCQVLGPPLTHTSLSKSSTTGIQSRDRKNMWRPVVGCLELTAGQMCNLTRVFTDPYTHYKARVQAFTTTQTSSWTESGWFQPISDTVLGPPDVSVSGCGNCLILQLKPPATKGLQCNLQLENLYRGVILHVRRTRDGAQFRLNLPFSEEKVIMYLQPGVEYCVSISVTALLKSNHVASKPYCAFTSHPPSSSSLYLVIGLLVFFCILGFLITGLVVNGGQRSFTILRQHLFTSLSYTNTS
ncbi:interferon alpha/beta receptor 2 isoform X1 [Pleuronectes platessa]|uniref:interferon alpha/beta receptor 2 isoform X1 n=1 Tax=Pleuronectes platessa TaxID=8262 RepID=UPI00232A441E|nr:interferon alpha/beta receptor 2 isoform X1 [Pleuronectes platessa]